MTTEQIDAMEAGPECDRAVGDACGIECTGYFYEGPVTVSVVRHISETSTAWWKPSTDWNDAMFAAERLGLFDDHVLDRGSLDDEMTTEWCISPVDPHEPCPPVFSHHATGPLAICRAILKLHAGGER